MKVQELNSRSRNIFRKIVEAYIGLGAPVGSRTLSKIPGIDLSPASIRNTMSDLEEIGLLHSPHTSAGRIPTETGLRLFVDGLLEMGSLSKEEQIQIEAQCLEKDKVIADVLSEATSILSGLSHCAGVVMVPKFNSPLKHIEFIYLNPGRGLVVLVTKDGSVENRTIKLPPGLPPSALQRASNYLNSHLEGGTIEQIKARVEKDLEGQQAQLDELTKKVVKGGLATWSGKKGGGQALIVKGRSNLIDEESGLENLERIRQLFDDLEKKESLIRLLDQAKEGDGVKIFIGAENNLFSLSGSSVIVSPYMNETGDVVGAIGVIGPTHLNYARIIPMVDYTARIISKIL
ncbi:MAG: heat-inducible transcriptional repressor HrcA [Sphingomonadales bacterium]